MRLRSIFWLIPILASFNLVYAQDWLRVTAENCDYGGEILAVEALDALTVQFQLCEADTAFASKLAFGAFAIHPSEYLQATGGTGELLARPIGTGPYTFENWSPGEEITLRRNENYWGPLAFDARVVIRWNESVRERYEALTGGEVDGIDNPGREAFELIRNDSNLVLYPRPSTTIFYLGLNNRYPPFDNVFVRQALAHAIDKEQIVETYYPEGSTVADQFMPPTIFGYTPEVRTRRYDLERAHELLTQSGVSLPIRVQLNYRNVPRGYLPDPVPVAIELQRQLREIGIEVVLNEMESGAFLDASTAGELPMFLLGWLPDYPDATNFLDFHFGISSSDSFGNKFAEITEPLLQAARLVDPDERYPLYIQANTAIYDLVPMIPIAYGGSATAFRAPVAGAHSSPLNFEYLAVMDDQTDDELVFMQNAEPISLYCADELDGESFRVCNQVNEALLSFSVAGATVIPSLATAYETSEDGRTWTFHLRDGVTFHDGSPFDANDVVLSFVVQWDASHPLHTGREGTFTYFSTYFRAFLNDND
jgi:peptide/nickel transport system substrate-binding protein